jgi:hypothetical protein
MMLFKKQDVPGQVKAVGVEKWYDKLDDSDKVKLKRYLEKADASSQFDFFISIVRAAIAEENYAFAVKMCQDAYSFPMSDMQRFTVSEELIDALIGTERYDEAKLACESNLKLFPNVREEVMAVNGGTLPKKLNFRNRYIDVIVGIESNYDKAFEMLDVYLDMGLIDKEEHEYRVNSLRTHRLQRSFDGIYTYRPVGKDL